MKRNEDEKRGWILVVFFLLIGLVCVTLAGNLAIRFAPSWSLRADMRSRLSPDSLYSTPLPGFVFQPLDPAILTPPVWMDVFLTPGATFPTRQPNPTSMPTEWISPTLEPTGLPVTAVTPTNTQPVYLPATPTSTMVPLRTPSPRTATPASPGGPTTPPTFTPTATPTFTSIPSSTPTSTPTGPSQADLQISMSDGVLVYSAGSSVTYNVVVSNSGPGTVTGAHISSAFPAQLSSWTWSCAGQTNGASGCDPAGSNAANFSDTVDLPVGSSITYTVTVNTQGGAYGSLVLTVSITPPASVPDPATGNNSVTDSNDLLNSLPYGDVGTSYDGFAYVLPSGGSLTIGLGTPLIVNGHPSWDLVFYELPNGSGIAMDLIVVQVSDGSNWYTIFNWGDNAPDTNSNLNIAVLGGSETDNRDFTSIPASDILYPFNSGTDANPSTGVVFELDGVVPNGTYPYIRFIASAGDVDGGAEIDAVTILP